MSVLGNDEYSTDMDKIHRNTLVDMFKKLEANRDVYLSNLNQKHNVIDKERQKFVEEIRKVLEV